MTPWKNIAAMYGIPRPTLRIKPSLGAVSKASFIRRIGFQLYFLAEDGPDDLCGGWLPTLLETPPFSLWLP